MSQQLKVYHLIVKTREQWLKENHLFVQKMDDSITNSEIISPNPLNATLPAL